MTRWRSNTQAEYETAEEELIRRQDDWMVAADAYCDDPGDPDLAPHEWPSHRRMIDAHRLYRDAATALSRLRP